MDMELKPGSIVQAMAVAALDQGQALYEATVELQAQVRKELGEAQAVLRQESAALQAAFRKEASGTLTVIRQETEALKALRQVVQGSVEELQALQPGIERSAGLGVQAALTAGMARIRSDLAIEIAGSVREIKEAAQQARSMVRRLTPLWAGIIAAGGLLLGMLFMYFVMAHWQQRIEGKIDRLPQIAPVPVQAPAPPPATGSGNVRLKTHGSKAAASKPKSPQTDPRHVPTAEEQP